MKKYFNPVVGILLYFLPKMAFAQIRPFPWNSPPLSGGSIVDLALGFAQWLYIIAGIIMGITLVWSGLTYMSAGSDATRVNKAKSILKNGIIGAVIFFGVGTIINTIDLLARDPGSFF